MEADRIAALFTRPDGSFLCARWGRPVAPVIFGLADESLAIFRAAITAGFTHAGHPLAETDPEMGANFMVFVMRGWDELASVPDLAALTGQHDLPERLAGAGGGTGTGADQYRILRFDPDGGIRACVMFLRMAGPLGQAHPATLAEALTMRAALSFATEVTPGPDLAALIRAAYDPVLPVAATDASHALRLAARLAR